MIDKEYDDEFDPIQDRFDNNDYNKYDNQKKEI